MALLKNKSSSVALRELDSAKVRFTIRDTEFLIRFIMSNMIDGKDIETSNAVLQKLKKIHDSLMSEVYEV